MASKSRSGDGPNRREAPRASIEMVIQYQSLEHFCQDYVRNVSLGGLFIESSSPLPIGATLTLSFALPGYEGLIQTDGRVVRSISPEMAQERGFKPGMAVRFQDLSEQHKSVIDALVRRSLEED